MAPGIVKAQAVFSSGRTQAVEMVLEIATAAPADRNMIG
jgi:hypothetical protein